MKGVKLRVVTEDNEGIRIDRWLRKCYPQLTQGRLEKLIRTGQVRVDGSRIKSNFRLVIGQKVRVPPLLENLSSKKVDSLTKSINKEDRDYLKTRILHMDEHILVVDKPLGLPVQGGSKVLRHLDGMLDTLGFDKNERPRLVHRLDKDTCGVLILARSRKSAVFLGEAFRSGRIRKLYWALVNGVPRPRSGSIDLALSKGPINGHEKVLVNSKGKTALTKYSVIESVASQVSWLALEPITGRTHQLRVHCNQIGTPIIGDRKYGGNGNFSSNFTNFPFARRLQLISKAIRVPNPVGGHLEIDAPLPEHMSKMWEYFGFDPNHPSDFLVDRYEY